MSFTSTLTSKNQTTIPKKVVEALQLKPSATLHYEVEEDGRVVLTAKTGTFAGLADRFPKKRRAQPASLEEMDAAIRAGAVKRFKKAVS
ncbi:MAG TPA: type II toxin-antitoxin system PrlF family antitoxin [Prosthecobacter sp.]